MQTLPRKFRPKEDVEKAAQAFPMLKKVGTEVVDRLEAYTGGVYPISQEDQDKIDLAKKLQRHIDALKADDLPTASLEEQLKAIKLPDVANKALLDKKDLDARLLEIEQKAATAKSQLTAALVKIDQKEQDEVDTLEKEVMAWRNEYEAKATIARKDRVAAKEKNAADRAALLKTEELRAAEQLKLTTETQSSLMKAASAQPPTIGQALQAGGGNPAQAPTRPAPPQAAPLPAMVTSEDLQQYVAKDVHFTGTGEEAAHFAQCMLDYMHLKAKETPTQDASMAEPEVVEFSDFTDNEVDNGASASAPKVKRKYKMTAAARDAMFAEKATKGASTGVSGTK